MYKLDKSDIEKLKPIEPYFLQIRENYKRSSLVSEDMVVAEIYTKLTGKVEKNFACGQCSFRMYKTVGDAYFEALKEIENITDDTKTTTPNKNKTTTKTVKKNGQRRTKAKKE